MTKIAPKDTRHASPFRLNRNSRNLFPSPSPWFVNLDSVPWSMDLINYFVRQYKHIDEDQLTIQLLGIRLFNGTASALSLLCAGYYQASVLLQRDLLEVIFLLDYFKSDRAQIAVWRTADGKGRQKKFKPVKIREALDGRDGFTERKRAKAYDLLCDLAGHATPTGFRMLTPVPGGDANCGPFFDATALDATLSELAKHLLQAAGLFNLFFKPRGPVDYEAKIGFLEAQGPWVERFFGRPFDRAPIDELRALMVATAR